MLGFGMLTKMAKGGIGPDELAAICEAAGMDVEFTDVPKVEAREAFLAAANSLTCPGGRMVRISGAMKGGDRMEALIVLVPAPKVVSEPQETLLTPAMASR